MRPTIYVPRFSRLGDSIVSIGNAIELAKREGRRLRVAPHPKLLDLPEALRAHKLKGFYFALSLFNWKPYLRLKKLTPRKVFKLLPTRPIAPYPAPKPVIAYDFLPSKRENRASKLWRHSMLKHLRGTGAELINLHALSLRDGLETAKEQLQRATCFVGHDSGFAHLAHALHISCHLIRVARSENTMRRWHGQQAFYFYQSPEEFVEKFRLT